MTNIEEIKKLRNEHFKNMFTLGDIVKMPSGRYGYICALWDEFVNVITDNGVECYSKLNLKKINEEEAQFDVLDWLKVGDTVGISHDFPAYIKGIKKTIKRGSYAMVTEKLEKGARIKVYVGDDLVIVDAPCDCLYRLSNAPLVVGLKTQLKPTANSNGYSSPLAEMLEKEKEEERTIEKMTYFEGNTTYEKEKVPHVKRLFLMRQVVDGEPVWGWFMENGKFYPRKEI